MTALGYRGWIVARAGDLAAAEAELRPLVDAVVEHDMPLLVAGGAFFALDAMLERSSLEGLAATVEALEADRRFLETGGGAMIVETRGRLRLARGDREGALADLRTCGATYAALGFGPPFSFWRSALALALPPEARDEALALVDEDVRRAVATGLDRPHGVALRAAGLVRGGDEGLGCLCESVALLAPHRPASSTRAPSSSWAPRCAAAGSAPGRVSRWPRGWSSRTPAGPSGSSPAPARSFARRARGRAASCARAWPR